MLMYRKDLLEAKGLTMPEQPTYDDIKKFADALTDKAQNIYGITLRGKPGWGENMAYVGTLLNTFGCTWFDLKWNPTINTPEWKKLVYTTSSVALAVLEILVHTHDRRVLNGRFSLFEVQIPAGLITDPVLPNDIGEITTTRQIGSQWIKKATHPALRVRSIITGEANYILNPNHPDFLKIEITDPQIFYFDQRLFP